MAPTLTVFLQVPGQAGMFVAPSAQPMLGLDVGDRLTSGTIADLNEDGRLDIALTLQDGDTGTLNLVDRCCRDQVVEPPASSMIFFTASVMSGISFPSSRYMESISPIRSWPCFWVSFFRALVKAFDASFILNQY